MNEFEGLSPAELQAMYATMPEDADPALAGLPPPPEAEPLASGEEPGVDFSGMSPEALQDLYAAMPDDTDASGRDLAKEDALADLAAAGRAGPGETPTADPSLAESYWGALNQGFGILFQTAGTLSAEVSGEGNVVAEAAHGIAESIRRKHPSAIEKPSDILDKPGTAIAEGLGEQSANLGTLALTTAMGARTGAMAGALLGPGGAVVGGTAGGAVSAAMYMWGQAYAENIDRQKAVNPGKEPDRLTAAGTAVVQATLEKAIGPERFVGKAAAGKLKEALGTLGEKSSRIVHAGKEGLKGGAGEAITEPSQNFLTELQSGADPLSDEALDQYALAGAKAFVSGGVVQTGIGALAPRARAEDSKKKAEDAIKEEGEAPPKPQAPPRPEVAEGEDVIGEYEPQPDDVLPPEPESLDEPGDVPPEGAEQPPLDEGEGELDPNDPDNYDKPPGTEGIEVEEVQPEEVTVQPPARGEYNPAATVKDFDYDIEAFLTDAIDRPETTLNTVLDRIATLKNPVWSTIAKHLRKLDLNVSTRMTPAEDLQDAEGRQATGDFQYSYAEGFAGKGKIRIAAGVHWKGADSMTTTVIHEAVHAATAYVLTRFNKGLSLSPSAKTAASKMDELYRYSLLTLRSRGIKEFESMNTGQKYGFSRLEEFVAEAFSRKEFQEILKTLPALNPTGKIRTAWNQIINTVRMSLGMPNNPQVMNALDEAMSLGLDVMQVQQRGRVAYNKVGQKRRLKEAADYMKKAGYTVGADGLIRDPQGRLITKDHPILQAKEGEAPTSLQGQDKLEALQSAMAPTPKKPSWVSNLASKVLHDVAAPALGGRASERLPDKRALSPTLQKLFDMIEHRQARHLKKGQTAEKDFTEKVMEKNGMINRALDKVFDPERSKHAGWLSTAARERIVSEVRAGADTRAAKQIRKVLDYLHAYAKASGLDISYVTNYFPRMYRIDVLNTADGKVDFLRALTGHGINPKDAEDIHFRIVQEDGIFMGPSHYSSSENNRPGRATWQKHRSLEAVPDSALSPFMYNDPRTILQRYAGHVIRRAEHARIFGAAGEKLTKTLDQIKDELYKAGKPLEQWEEKFIKGFSQALIGRYNPILKKGFLKFNKMTASYQLIRTGSWFTVSSLAEPLVALERGGGKAFAGGVYNALGYAGTQFMRSFTKTVPKHQIRQHLEDLHLIVDNSVADVLREGISGNFMSRMLKRKPKAGPGATPGLVELDVDMAAMQSGRGIQLFFKANMLEPWTNFTRAISMETGKISIKDTIDGFNRAPGGTMEQRLRDLGLDPASASQWFDRTQGDFGKMDPYQGAMKSGLTRFVNDVAMYPRVATQPLWKSDPHFHLAKQLTTFQGNFGNTVGRRWLANMNLGTNSTKEDYAKAAYTVGTVGVMMFAGMAVNEGYEWLIHGDKGNPKYKNEPMWHKVARAMERVAFTGGLQPAINFFVADDFKRAGALAGPAAGQLWNIVDALHGNKGQLAYEIVQAIPLFNAMPKTWQKGVIKELKDISRDTGTTAAYNKIGRIIVRATNDVERAMR